MHFNKILQQQQEQEHKQNTNYTTTATLNSTTISNSKQQSKAITTPTTLTTCERDTAQIRETIDNISDINKYTSSEDSCTSSTDSGVHLNDNEAAPRKTTQTSSSSLSPSPSSSPSIPPLRQQISKNSKNNQAYEDKVKDNSCCDDADEVNGRKDERHRATLNRIFDNKFRNEPRLRNSTRSNNESNYDQQNVVEHENLINSNKKRSSDEASQLNGAIPKAVINPTTHCETVKHSTLHNGFDEPMRSPSPAPSSIVYTSDSSDDEPSPRPPNHQHINRSSAVSIRSIDSSVVDSDSDSDLTEAIEGVHENYVIKKLGTQVSYPPRHPDIPKINNGLQVINHQITPHGMGAPPPPPSPMDILSQMNENFSRLTSPHHQHNGQLATPSMTPQIAVSASKDITIGDKHFYEGPVTIQQFLIDSRDKWKKDENTINGKDNPSFEGGTGAPESYNNAKDINLSATSELPKKTFVKWLLKNKKYVIPALLITMVLVISAIVLGVKGSNDNTSTITKPNKPGYTDDVVIVDGKLCLIERDLWRARPQAHKLDPQKLPLERVIIAHTASEPCDSQMTCSDRVRSIQNFHMDSFGWDDIGYNFLIDSNGCVYVGRGWDDVGAHTKGYNVNSVGIAFIGTYITTKPTEAQLNACRLLIEDGIKLDKLLPTYKLYGARQMGATESPGEALYRIIRTWDHWTPNV